MYFINSKLLLYWAKICTLFIHECFFIIVNYNIFLIINSILLTSKFKINIIRILTGVIKPELLVQNNRKELSKFSPNFRSNI